VPLMGPKLGGRQCRKNRTVAGLQVLWHAGSWSVSCCSRWAPRPMQKSRPWRLPPIEAGRTVLAYDRTPTTAAEANTRRRRPQHAPGARRRRRLEAALRQLRHLLREDLRNAWPPRHPSGDHPLAGPSHLFYLANGDFGIVATRVARGGGPDGTQASSILFAAVVRPAVVRGGRPR